MRIHVVCVMNNTEITISRGRGEDKGSRLLLSSMSAPEPFAHQFLGLMPLPMNRAANRLGCVDCAPVTDSALPKGSDSSQGNAIVTPTPRSRVRRLMQLDGGFMASIPRLVSVGV